MSFAKRVKSKNRGIYPQCLYTWKKYFLFVHSHTLASVQSKGIHLPRRDAYLILLWTAIISCDNQFFAAVWCTITSGPAVKSHIAIFLFPSYWHTTLCGCLKQCVSALLNSKSAESLNQTIIFYYFPICLWRQRIHFLLLGLVLQCNQITFCN